MLNIGHINEILEDRYFYHHQTLELVRPTAFNTPKHLKSAFMFYKIQISIPR